MIIFSILILVLVFRPNGLLGRLAPTNPRRPARRQPKRPDRPGHVATSHAFHVPAANRYSHPDRRRAIAFPLVHDNEGDIDAAANATAFAVLALGLNIVVGFAGLLDLGYAAFFAIGAYTYGILSRGRCSRTGVGFWEPFQWLGFVARIHAEGCPIWCISRVSFWIAMPICGAVAAFFGVVFGAPTLRLRGDYLAIVTLGFGEIVPIVARNTPYLTNGAIGLNGAAPPRLFGYSFGVASSPYYYLGLLMVGLLVFVSLRLQSSPVGRAWMAIREDEIAAGAMGINRTRLKLLAFAIGAAFGGMTGAFYVAKLQTATPDMFMFPVSVMILVMVVLGGMGSVYGVVLAAIILQLLQSWFLQDLTGWMPHAGPRAGQRLASARRSRPVHRAHLRHHPRLHDALPPPGLIPATRSTPALTLEQQTAHVGRGGFASPIRGIEAEIERPKDAPKLAMLETRKLTRRYGGIVAVKELDITVERHSIVALIGPNGSGKTTTFNLITGMDEPSAGKILLLGHDITGLPPM